MSTLGLVNKIIPFSVVDGPGNRSAVFLQGCNFNCAYCHNPETLHACIHCGECVKACEYGALQQVDNYVVWQEEKCTGCDACLAACDKNSTPKTKQLTASDVFTKLKNALPFIRGITVSGGEATLQPGFVEELFCLAKSKGLTTLLDSNGSLDFTGYENLLAVTDGVMLDVKAFTPHEHQELTGNDNWQVLKNIEFLASQNKLHEVRTVVSSGFFNMEKTVAAIAEKIAKWETVQYKLIGYRPIGVRKQYAVYTPPTKEELFHLQNVAKAQGVKNVTIV